MHYRFGKTLLGMPEPPPGTYFGQANLKAGKAFNLQPGETFNGVWKTSRGNFILAELGYVLLGGLCYSQQAGLGWRAALQYDIGYETKVIDAEIGYQHNYVYSNSFGARVVPWSFTFSVRLH